MFTLRRVHIMGHKILKDLDLSFCNDKTHDYKAIYNSVIIGKNGVGKSNIMRVLIEIFNNLASYKESASVPKRLPYRYVIEYDIDVNHYYVTNDEKDMHLNTYYRIPAKTISCYRNDMPIRAVQLELPGKVIASTMTITDKFPTTSTNLYKYSGARNERTTSTSTRAIVRRTAESIMYGLGEKNDFRNELSRLLDNIGLAHSVIITYHIKYKDVFFRQSMTADLLIDIFDNQSKYINRESELWGKRYFDSIRKNRDKLNVIIRFLRKYSQPEQLQGNNFIVYDVFKDEQLTNEKEALMMLSSLDILTYPEIHVIKGEQYPMEDSSSGESQILCQFIGIMSAIRQDSLILIDEPENSCHPEWQMLYIDWLKDVFARYASCHFVIATHSPSILMNLKAKESTIIPLKRTGSGISINEKSESKNTYGWKYEDVLQYTMGTNNIYIAEYVKCLQNFDDAVAAGNAKEADQYYTQMLSMLREDDVLRTVLRIQTIGLK